MPAIAKKNTLARGRIARSKMMRHSTGPPFAGTAAPGAIAASTGCKGRGGKFPERKLGKVSPKNISTGRGAGTRARLRVFVTGRDPNRRRNRDLGRNPKTPRARLGVFVTGRDPLWRRIGARTKSKDAPRAAAFFRDLPKSQSAPHGGLGRNPKISRARLQFFLTGRDPYWRRIGISGEIRRPAGTNVELSRGTLVK